jgi:hypothetical protein
MKRYDTILISVMLLAIAPALAAQQSPSKKEKSPDFTREGVLQVFVDDLTMGRSSNGPFDAGFTYTTPSTRFHWVPFMMPFTFGTGAERVSLSPYVDPFALTGTSFPYTASSHKDRFGEWRTRRMLRRNVEAANRSDND